MSDERKVDQHHKKKFKSSFKDTIILSDCSTSSEEFIINGKFQGSQRIVSSSALLSSASNRLNIASSSLTSAIGQKSNIKGKKSITVNKVKEESTSTQSVVEASSRPSLTSTSSSSTIKFKAISVKDEESSVTEEESDSDDYDPKKEIEDNDDDDDCIEENSDGEEFIKVKKVNQTTRQHEIVKRGKQTKRAGSSSKTIFNSRFFKSDQYILCIRNAEEIGDDGKARLLGIVHMQAERNILFWHFRVNHYVGKEYLSLAQSWNTTETKVYKVKQIHRQIYLFKMCIKKGVSKDYLVSILEPFLNHSNLRNMWSQTSIVNTVDICDNDMTTMAKLIIKNCSRMETSLAEKNCRETGSIGIETFIQKLKHFKPVNSKDLPFHNRNQPGLPTTLYYFAPKDEYGNVVTKYNRTSLTQYTFKEEADRDCLGKFDAFHAHFKVYETHQERVHVIMVKFSEWQIQNIFRVFMVQLQGPTSTGTLIVVNKDQNAEALAKLFMLPKETRLYTLDIKDFVDVATYQNLLGRQHFVRERLAVVEFAQQSTLPRIATFWSFWSIRAVASMYRQRKEDGATVDQATKKQQNKALKDFVMHLFRMQDFKCNLCDLPLTTFINRCFSNGSIDRRLPGQKGGRYDDFTNIQVVCKCCNLSKFHYSSGSAAVQAGIIAKSKYKVTSNLLFDGDRKVIAKVPIEGSEMKLLVEPWCRKLLRNKQGQNKVKCTLDKQFLIDLVADRWIGKGLVEDVSGARLYLYSMQLDRIDSSKGYHKDNVRLLNAGANLIKSDSEDDKEYIRWLDHLFRNEKVIDLHDQALAQGHKLPYANTIEGILAQTCEAKATLESLTEHTATYQEEFDEFNTQLPLLQRTIYE
ncbi:hypothetical protein CBS101457_000356 [Exobasidium rhododendri]|nr:hypothetical protein CBS101457_000356 [Exobasidium rhododendri]